MDICLDDDNCPHGLLIHSHCQLCDEPTPEGVTTCWFCEVMPDES